MNIHSLPECPPREVWITHCRCLHEIDLMTHYLLQRVFETEKRGGPFRCVRTEADKEIQIAGRVIIPARHC